MGISLGIDAVSVISVAKKDGSFRLCVDWRGLDKSKKKKRSSSPPFDSPSTASTLDLATLPSSTSSEMSMKATAEEASWESQGRGNVKTEFNFWVAGFSTEGGTCCGTYAYGC